MTINAPPMRLRQLCLIAPQLEPALENLTHLLNTQPCYRDPEIAHFGLVNGLIELQGDFLEIVSPVKTDSAGARFLKRQGEGGYMVLLQCEDATAMREHITGMGVRAVWKVDGARDEPSVVATHFHPRDVGGAILSIDSMGEEAWQAPRSRWVWGGKAWQAEAEERAGQGDGLGPFIGAEIMAAEPQGMAAHWAAMLGRKAQMQDEGAEVRLSGAWLRFVPSDGRPDGLTAIHLGGSLAARRAFYHRASERGLVVERGRVSLCGVEWVVG